MEAKKVRRIKTKKSDNIASIWWGSSLESKGISSLLLSKVIALPTIATAIVVALLGS